MKELIDKLDLSTYVQSFETFLARSKPLFIEGDQQRHFDMIAGFDTVEFNPPLETAPLDDAIMRLKKQGIVPLHTVFEFVKMVRYFDYLKKQKFPSKVFTWLEEVDVPEIFTPINEFFLEKGEINVRCDEKLLNLEQHLSRSTSEVKTQMQKHLHQEKLQPYLVDKQIHLINEQETLLLKAGFNHVIKGTIISRSATGFFYILPQSIEKLKTQVEHFIQAREELLYEYAKSFSATLHKWTRFLEFLNKRFDVVDHYQARVHFARMKGYEFLLSSKNDDLILRSFSHPALANPKPISIDASKNIIMVTGVNAGGKTMLLKALLSAVWLSKYILPMKIDAKHSSISRFKSINAVIDDPQSVGNDISTFAGRMVEFSALLGTKEAIIGVDEIELGTDSDEAASLFKVMLESLVQRGAKIIVTTHHKRLAALMADRDDVTLIAALYDEVNRKPMYEFLQGSIGKSYAFETALRYGIPSIVVNNAIEQYGDDQAKLSELIERSSELERSLRDKHNAIDEKLANITKVEHIILDERESLHHEVQGEKGKLSMAYHDAISEARKAAKAQEKPEIHRHMNKAHKKLPKQDAKNFKKEQKLAVGDRVRYLTNFGLILSIEGKNAMVEFESGMRMRAKLIELSLAPHIKAKAPQVQVSKPRAKSSSLKLDLHGLRAEEAMEKLDTFLSNALLEGWDEVLVYHGIGTGKLSYAVKEFLKIHPCVKSFSDAPQSMGGFGAKVISL